MNVKYKGYAIKSAENLIQMAKYPKKSDVEKKIEATDKNRYVNIKKKIKVK